MIIHCSHNKYYYCTVHVFNVQCMHCCVQVQRQQATTNSEHYPYTNSLYSSIKVIIYHTRTPGNHPMQWSNLTFASHVGMIMNHTCHYIHIFYTVRQFMPFFWIPFNDRPIAICGIIRTFWPVQTCANIAMSSQYDK